MSATLVLSTGCKDDGGDLPYDPFKPPIGGGSQQSDGGTDSDAGTVVLSDGGSFELKPTCATGSTSCAGACPDGGVVCAGNCGFLAPVTYPLAGGATSLAVGDLNGDGSGDLVVTTGDKVAVLLNQKNGRFQTPTLLPASGPSAVTLTYLDADPKLDLVIANSGGKTLSVYQGSGTGTFSSVGSFPTGSELNGLAPITLSGGASAIAVLRGDTQKVGVSRLNGTQLQTAAEYDAASSPAAMVVDDFNQDGRQDIAVTHPLSCTPAEARCQSVGVLLSNGDGTFQAQRFSATGGEPRGILSADLNSDSIKDLVVTDASNKKVLVMFGNGDGTFRTPVSHAVGIGPAKLVLADINRDSVPDLLVSNGGDNKVSLLAGQPGGTFLQQVSLTAYPQGVGLRGLAVEDFDGDGVRDMAVLSSAGVQMLWGICR